MKRIFLSLVLLFSLTATCHANQIIEVTIDSEYMSIVNEFSTTSPLRLAEALSQTTDGPIYIIVIKRTELKDYWFHEIIAWCIRNYVPFTVFHNESQYQQWTEEVDDI